MFYKYDMKYNTRKSIRHKKGTTRKYLLRKTKLQYFRPRSRPCILGTFLHLHISNQSHLRQFNYISLDSIRRGDSYTLNCWKNIKAYNQIDVKLNSNFQKYKTLGCLMIYFTRCFLQTYNVKGTFLGISCLVFYCC